MNIPRKWLISGGIAVIVVGSIAYRAAFIAKKPTVHTIDVRKGYVAEEVSETGTVVTSDDINLFFKNTGRVAAVLVKEGQVVEQGQQLMRQETGELSAALRSAASALAAARAKYDQAIAGATPEEIRVYEAALATAEARAAAAKRALEDAQLALIDAGNSNDATLASAYGDLKGLLETLYNKTFAGYASLKNDVFDSKEGLSFFVVPDNLVSLAAQLSNEYPAVKTAIAKMESDMNALRASASNGAIDSLTASLLASARLIQNNVRNADALAQGSTPSASVSSSSYDTKKTNIRTALTDLNAAVNNVDAKILSISSTKASNASALTTAQTKVNSSQTALATAEADVRSAKEQLALKRAPLREVDKQVFLAAIDAAQADLDLARRRLEEATIVAPKAGIIGTTDVVTGELSGPANRAVSMISTEYEVEAEVSELDIRKITPGLRVELAFDALGPTVYSGKIAEIGAREIKKDDDIFYKITASLDDASLPLKPGMTAEMTMRIGEQADALLIPKRLLIKRSGKTSVRAYINEEVTEISVRVGLEGDDDVQILEGLGEGDKIVESVE